MHAFHSHARHFQSVGDVIKAMNGKSIEVTDTDAEGRLILVNNHPRYEILLTLGLYELNYSSPISGGCIVLFELTAQTSQRY
jgi:hypothetical protein